MDNTEFVTFLFMKPLCFVLSDIIATPKICESLHVKFIEHLYLIHNLGSKINNEQVCDKTKCRYSFSINEMIYIGEIFEPLDILFKVEGFENLQSKWNKQLFKPTYENVSSIYSEFNMNEKNQLLARYVIYKYFKDRNYTVRDGLKFGADYILYNNSPSLVHGKHCIFICKFTEEEGRKSIVGEGEETVVMHDGKSYVVEFPVVNYKKIIGLSRLCESVSKKLVLVGFDSKSQQVQNVQVSRYLG